MAGDPTPDQDPSTDEPRVDRSLFAELKRRHVYRVSAVFIAVAFAVWQAADIVVDALGLPSWIMTVVVIGPILTFPFAVLLAWAYELTPDGVRRTSEVDATRPSTETATASRFQLSVWRRSALGATLLVVLATGSWLALSRRAPRATDLSDVTLAVFPFTVRGSDGLDYLRHGLVDLLSRNLSGALELQPLDPSLILRLTGGTEPKSVADAGAIARRAGAGQFVIGSVSESGGQLRVDASLYQLRDSVVVLATKTVQGDTTQLFRLIDQLTAALLAERITGAASERLIRTAAVTTSSLPALKAYLEGEQHYRAGMHADAAEAFNRALDEDSTFVLARYRLAVSYHMRGEYDAARRELDRTIRDESRLGPHDRRVARAFHGYYMGDVETAERQLHTVIREFSRDLEARVILAELLINNSPYRGERVTEAKQLLAAVLEADPKFACIYCRLSEAADADGDTALFNRTGRLMNTGDTTRLSTGSEHHLLVRSGDTAAARTLVLADADTAPLTVQTRIFDVGGWSAVTAGQLPYAQALVDLADARNARGPWHPVIAAVIAIETGQWHRANDMIGPDPWPGMTLDEYAVGVLTSMPFEFTGRGIDNLMDRIRSWDAGSVTAEDAAAADAADWESRLRPAHRHFLLGAAASRAGQSRAAIAHADSLDMFVAVNPDLAVPVSAFAHTVRADVALRSGDAAGALRALDRIRVSLPPGWFTSAVGYYTITLRALAHGRAGNHDESLRWLTRGVAWSGVPGPGWSTAWNLEMAHTLDALGRRAEATAHYAVVLDAWQNADAELQPRVEAARRRLAELVRER